MEGIFKIRVDNIIYKISVCEISSNYIYYEVYDDRKTICTLRHEINQVGKLVWAMIENQKEISHPFAARIGARLKDFWLFSYFSNGINLKDIAFLK